MRLIDRNDTSLAVALIASALVIFQQPLRLLVDTARDVELRYNLDLLPGLTVLVGTFGFHQYRKRQQAKAAEAAASTEAALARARSAELERLVAFGRALGNAFDPAAMRQVFWRYMPTFTGEREVWMLTRTQDGWEAALCDATVPTPRPPDQLEAIATTALAHPDVETVEGDGLLIDNDLCFPMIVGDIVIGVVGVRHGGAVTRSERHALSAAAALLAIAIRNSQLLTQTRENSIRDSLTGCFNRSYAMETLVIELQRARRTRRPLSVLMFDVDEFKSVNDRFGHLAGDSLLAAIGARLGSMLRASDIKCRYGGDEFLVILPDTALVGAAHLAAALIEALADLHVPAGTGFVSPTVSVGVATAAEGDIDPMSVVATADQALYCAKREGRNRYSAAPLASAV